MDLCLRGGRLIDPARGFDAEADLLLAGGVVARVGAGIAGGVGREVRVVDVRGRWVVPGLIDLHTHLREPGGGVGADEVNVRRQVWDHRREGILEIEPSVADSPRAVILDQVARGVAVRMAVLYLLAGGETAAE